VYGPDILARFLEKPGKPDRFGNAWQYNSQSDRHSKVGCWGVAFDLLLNSNLLRQHAKANKVVLGVNHTMRDFETGRRKALDLVIARPESTGFDPKKTFAQLVNQYGIELTPEESSALHDLPEVYVAEVGAVLVALEAKAAMTAHQAALPRLYDELNSSHLAVHGASAQALAIAYVQINAAAQFLSSPSNQFDFTKLPRVINEHVQPKAVNVVLKKIAELPRRSGTTGSGFDGIGITVLDLENLGGPVTILSEPPAPQKADPFFYDGMIVRMANEYDSRFHSI
jgi:hypothetical protein